MSNSDIEEDSACDIAHRGTLPTRIESARLEGDRGGLSILPVVAKLQSQDQIDSGVFSFPEDITINSLNSIDKLLGGLSVTDDISSNSSLQTSVNIVPKVELRNSQQIEVCGCEGNNDIIKKEDNLVLFSEKYDSNYSSLGLHDDELRVGHNPDDDDIVNGTSDETFLTYFECDEDGDTDLHNCIIQKRSDIALHLINLVDSSEFLDIPNALLQTPLHLAVITNQSDIVRKLMVRGASLDVRDSKGNTPLHIACSKGYTDIVKKLLEPLLYSELIENHYDITYPRPPQDLNLRNYDGLSCLHLAILGCHLDCLRLLLENRANINTPDGKSGRTILHYAAEKGSVKLLKFILMWPSTNINEKTYGGLTAIALCKGRGHRGAMEMLYKYGADMSELDYEYDEEDDMETSYNDFEINGEPVSLT